MSQNYHQKNSLEVTCTIKTKMQAMKTEKEFSVNDRSHSPGTRPIIVQSNQYTGLSISQSC